MLHYTCCITTQLRIWKSIIEPHKYITPLLHFVFREVKRLSSVTIACYFLERKIKVILF